MSFKTDLGSFYKNIKSHSGTYGIEIETEVASPAAYPESFINFGTTDDSEDHIKWSLIDPKMSAWLAKPDGSLRNFGVEYVLKEPASYEDALRHLDDFGEATEKIPFYKDPFSASVHVHVNMWNEELLTFGNFCTLYLLFEGLLVHYSGECRISNLFALPTHVAEGNWHNITEVLTGLEQGDAKAIRIANQSAKYATFNLCSLTRFGSVEIRSMRGTTDVQVLKNWISIINDILKFSKEKGLTPPEIVSMYREKGTTFIFEIFGDDRGILLTEGLIPSQVERILDVHAFYAASIADVVKDWRMLDKVFKRGKNAAPKAVSLSDLYAGMVAGATPELVTVDEMPPASLEAADAEMANMPGWAEEEDVSFDGISINELPVIP